ncbi:MAG: insulinase family protein [Elusimicrobia bacterium]|nr:insulinase family protein [Elusimicrobiota bacterium]
MRGLAGLFLAGLLAVLPRLSWAQEAASASGAGFKKPDMSKVPEVGFVEPHLLPSRMKWKLANGFETILAEDHRSPLVTARLVVRSGWAAVPSELAGLADAMAELLTEGSLRYTAREIADAAQDYGGKVSVKAGPDAIVIETSGLSEHSERMLALLAEVSRSPTFPANEVELRKKNMKEELAAGRGDGEFLASTAFFKKLYRSHPYAVTAPTPASIGRITRKHIAAFHKKLFTPANVTLILAGDIGYEDAAKPVNAHFGPWKGLAEPVEAPAVVGGHDRRRVFLLDRPGASQSAVFMGSFAVREDHPQYYSLLAVNQAIGGTFSSRLMQDLRESKGWTYQVWSRLEHRLTSSIFRVRTPLRAENTGDGLKAIFKHLEEVRDKGITEMELAKAKAFLIGSLAIELETQAGLADALVQQKILRLPDDQLDSYATRVSAVTLESAARAAQTFIRPEEMTVVVVGDAKAIGKELAGFSEFPVTPVDQDGN